MTMANILSLNNFVDRFLSIIAFVSGTVWASFLCLVADRFPQKISIVFPRSRCDSCHTPLGIQDLVPIASWVSTKGRCAYCHAPIGKTSVFVELALGTFFIVLFYWRVSLLEKIVFADFVSFGVVLSLIDIRHKRLPHLLTGMAAVTGIVLQTVRYGSPFLPIEGWFVGALFLAPLAFFFPGKMGWGDVFWLAAIGTFIGPIGVVKTIILGSFIGIIFGGATIVLKKMKTTTIPFGPALFISGLLVFLGQNV